MFHIHDPNGMSLTDFEKDLQNVMDNLPDTTKKIFRMALAKCRIIVRRHTRKLVNKKTGNYYKAWRYSKVWESRNGFGGKLYNSAPHSHLVEYGHRQLDRFGNEIGFVKGKGVMDSANKEMEATWDENLEKAMDKVLEKL